MSRVGDTYPNQHLEVVVKAYLYRWNPTHHPKGCGMPPVGIPILLRGVFFTVCFVSHVGPELQEAQTNRMGVGDGSF